MISSVFWVLLLLFGSVSSQVTHSLAVSFACSDSWNFTEDFLVDDMGFGYPDFEKKRLVYTLTDEMEPPECTFCYGDALAQQEYCRNDLNGFMQGGLDLPETEEPPVVTLYLRDYEEVGVTNTLVCLVDQFYPPPVTVKWTRNHQDVTEGAQMGRNLPNDDSSFRMMATLDFTLEEGDVYTCSVEHQALDAPLTRTWESEVSRPSVGPAVFCGVGLAVGLVGVAVGTVLFVKGKQHQ